MEVIQAKVNSRLLSKADRLFTGTLEGRIIELLQNARRAEATIVRITNTDGQVTIQDNGRGIEDFGALLDLGRSGWAPALDSVEDPAGVGIFCLAPRKVTIRSGHRTAVITGKGWTGEPIPVQTTEDAIKGTELVFADSPWEFGLVDMYAAFTGLSVIVDGRACTRASFVSPQASPHPELGCQIEVCERTALSHLHALWKQNYYADNVLVNFHGQVVARTHMPVSEHLHYLVDLTGEPTGIRLVLPARIRLVENEAFELLKATVEKEAYRYIQKRGSHKLTFTEHGRAKELGIELSEADPVFHTGLLSGETVEPVAVVKPQDCPLEKCYRLSAECRAVAQAEANVHRLGALGTFEGPFVVVDIPSAYDGYRWAKLPVVDRVEVTVGKELTRQCLCCETLVAVDSIEITAHTSDGRVFRSNVPMAIREVPQTQGRHRWTTVDVLVTPAARKELTSTDIWYHLGGFSEDGDTYDTQLEVFQEELNLFWSTVVGPGEYMRQRLLDCLREFGIRWRQVTVESSGKVWISYQDGSAQMLQPPELSDGQ